MKNHKHVAQHKRSAMGGDVGFSFPQKAAYASGGLVRGNMGNSTMKTGIPDSPVEAARRTNGVPGMKTGGSVK